MKKLTILIALLLITKVFSQINKGSIIYKKELL